MTDDFAQPDVRMLQLGMEDQRVPFSSLLIPLYIYLLIFLLILYFHSICSPPLPPSVSPFFIGTSAVYHKLTTSCDIPERRSVEDMTLDCSIE